MLVHWLIEWLTGGLAGWRGMRDRRLPLRFRLSFKKERKTFVSVKTIEGKPGEKKKRIVSCKRKVNLVEGPEKERLVRAASSHLRNLHLDPKRACSCMPEIILFSFSSFFLSFFLFFIPLFLFLSHV